MLLLNCNDLLKIKKSYKIIKMKYKKLTKEQIIITLDRLTRFKNTKDKYLRVYTDILTSNLIEPKFKKTDLETLDFSIITDYVVKIFNNSLGSIKPNSYIINNILKNYENSVFINDIDTQKLLDNKIDYISAMEFISDDMPINLLWLKELSKNLQLDINFSKLREENSLKYPIEEVILVEGITEETLLPVFARFLGYDFYKKGIQIISAGGKNQVVKKYYELANELKIPIFVLLDKDAEENIAQISPKLRSNDRIHLVSCGEFEDLLPKSLIIKTVNSHFKNFLTVTDNDFDINIPTAKNLEEIFKKKGLHEFKKAEFAKLVKEKISANADVSEEIKIIIDEIANTNKKLDTKFCS